MLLESFHVFPGSKGIQGQAQSLRRGKGFRRYLLWEVTYKWNMPWRIFAVAGFISAKSTPNWFSGLPENCGTAVNSREACTWLSSPLYIILQLWRIQFYQISNVCLISNACAFGQAQQDICGLWCRPSYLATLMLLVFDMSWRRPLESTKQRNIKGTSNEHQRNIKRTSMTIDLLHPLILWWSFQDQNDIWKRQGGPVKASTSHAYVEDLSSQVRFLLVATARGRLEDYLNAL